MFEPLECQRAPKIPPPWAWGPPNDRARLEQLCRYLLRPPLAQHRVQPRADGRVLLELKTVWRDGTSHLLFEPIAFIETLAAIIPRPTINLILYHGVLAPHARWRSQAVRYDRPARHGKAREFEASPRAAAPTRAWTWPALMRRVFDLDVLACPRCGGRLPVIATGLDPLAVRAILALPGVRVPGGTSAPRRARTWAQRGPASCRPRSITRIPLNGPFAFVRDHSTCDAGSIGRTLAYVAQGTLQAAESVC